MGYFNFKKPVFGSYLDTRNPPYMSRSKAALGDWKGHTAVHSSYNHERFNPQKARIEEGSIIEDWIPRQPTMLHLLLRKIYLRDAIAGTVVDLYSTLPWGKVYELIGVDDPKISRMYHDMIESSGIWGDLPIISREFLIIGRMIASLPFNESRGLWDTIVPIDPDQAKITPIPAVHIKPLVDVLSSPGWRSFARSIDPRVVEIKKNMLNKDLLDMLQNTSGYYPLEPMNTLFLARRVNQYDHIGTSFYTRILPAWAYETALWDASLTGVRRRNRSILLITAGIDEAWEPTSDELSALTQLAMQADEDPTGAVLSVRNGVEMSEIRDPAGIWGISQEFEFLSTLKMRALGVSEAYISGDTNVSNMAAATSSLGKAVAAFRDNLLYEIFAKQLFPTFARLHNFQKRTQAQLAHNIRVDPNRLDRMAEYDRRMRENDRLSEWGYPVISANQALDLPLSSLVIPRLITEDTLRPEQDVAYLEMLEKLKENQVPIPLRIWASSAGYDLDKAMAMMEEDIILKKRIMQLSSDAFKDDGDGSSSSAADDIFKGGGGDVGGSDLEQATTDSSSTLPPRWSFSPKRGTQASMPTKWSKDIKHIDEVLARFKSGHDPYVKLLSKISPNLLADLSLPSGSELLPFTD